MSTMSFAKREGGSMGVVLRRRKEDKRLDNESMHGKRTWIEEEEEEEESHKSRTGRGHSIPSKKHKWCVGYFRNIPFLWFLAVSSDPSEISHHFHNSIDSSISLPPSIFIIFFLSFFFFGPIFLSLVFLLIFLCLPSWMWVVLGHDTSQVLVSYNFIYQKISNMKIWKMK